MPHQLQSRFRGSTFVIDVPSAEIRKRRIKVYLLHIGIVADSSFTDAYFDELVEKTVNFSHRDLESLVKIAFSFCSPNETKIISQSVFNQAYEEYKNQTLNLWDFSDPATDDERRHRENIELAKTHYKDNKELQIKLAEFNALFQALLAAKTSGQRTPNVKETVEQFHTAESIIFPERGPRVKVESTWTSWNVTPNQ